MKRPNVDVRAADEAACKRETGRSRADWFAAIARSKASGRAAIGKFLQGEKVEAWWIPTLIVNYESKAGIVEKDGKPKGYSVCATKTVAAAPARAFKALTSAGDLDAWFGKGTRIDPAAGGRLENEDGNRATITKVRPDKALVFTWESAGFAEQSQVEILVQPKGDKCGLVVNHTRIATRRDSDEVRAAWDEALSRLKALLER